MKKAIKKFTTPVGTALDRFIATKQSEFPFATGELSQLLRDIALASKILNREINRAGLVGIESSIDMENIQGENQQMLDVVADIRFTRALTRGGQTCCILSEENDKIIETQNNDAKYVVTLDPLDGSSNINVNVSIGTIFSIYRRKTEVGTTPSEEDVLQKGRNQIAAGYILYGSSTMLVYTTGYGVNGFTYEPSLGEYFLSHPNMQVPHDGNIYSINEGSYEDFLPGIQQYIQYCKKERYMARYIGSLVADFHRNLLKGGIYLYPSTPKYPDGKLRLLYECNALAFIIEQAGGVASNGNGNILDIAPHDKHQRVPLIIGSKKMVKKVLSMLKAEGNILLDAG